MAPNPIRPWLKHLQQRFSPRRVRLGSESTHPVAGGSGKRLVCIVGRELCLYTRVDAVKVPQKQRVAFIELAVRRAAPFDDPDYGLAWTAPGQAGVWYWSRSRVNQLLGPHDPRKVDFLPEPVFTAGPAEGDLRELLALQHGFEGRIWRDGQLTASRWWPQSPPLPQWQALLRSAGLAPGHEDEVPSATPAPIALESWGRRQRGRAFDPKDLEALLPRVALVIGACALLVLTFEAGRLVRAHLDRAGSAFAAEQMDASLRRILDARESADADRARIESLLALRPSRSQGELLAEVGRLMEDVDWNLRHWRQPVEERIEVSMTVPGADAEKLVTAWEASPMFSGVTIDVSSRGDEVAIMARIDAPVRGEAP